MQRKRELVQVIIVLLVIVLVGSSCFSTKKERSNGGKNRQKLAFVDSRQFRDVSVEVQKVKG